MLKVVLLVALFSLVSSTTPALKRVNSKYLVSENSATFIGAYLSCKSFGYKLATVSNEEDQRLLNEVMNPSKAYWLGAAYVHSDTFESDWVWIESGSSLNYANWGEGSSTVLDGDFCLLQTNYGYWTSMGCSVKINYVCERQ